MTHADDKKLTLLLRGGLSESEKAKVMEHIAECDECADRMACLTLDMAAVDPPAGMSEDILAAAARENTREKRRQDNLLLYSMRVVAGICAALGRKLRRDGGAIAKAHNGIPPSADAVFADAPR